MKLSKRLQGILEMIPQGSVLADVGTDHGLLMIKAIKEQKVTFAYGLDINPLPLKQAHDNVVRFAYENKIQLILSDGLKSFEEKANCFVFAGMGTETILEIIKAYEFKDEASLIVQSNTKMALLREKMNYLGFKIIDEMFLMDKSIPTFIIKFTKGKEVLTPEDLILGPLLRNADNKSYEAYLNGREKHLESIKKFDKNLNHEYQCILNRRRTCNE